MSYLSVCVRNILHMNKAYSLINIREVAVTRQHDYTKAIRNHQFLKDIECTRTSFVEKIQVFHDAIKDSEYNWNICAELKVIGMLIRMQP